MSTAITRNPMRARFREQVREDVKAAALDQLAAGGAQAISVNAIAKQLGVSGPALYRYFASRDELLTALVIDAYADFRDALAEAVDTASGSTPDERLRALARAYRDWALAQPHRYKLLFAPPLPGYDAHAEPLAAAARSVMGVALGALDGLDLEDTPQTGDLTAALDRHRDVLAVRGSGAPEFRLAVSMWSRLHGIVSLELGGGFAAMHLDAEALFEHEVQMLVDRLDPVRREPDGLRSAEDPKA